MFIGGFQDIADDASLSYEQKLRKLYSVKTARYVRVMNHGNAPANSVAPLVGTTFAVDDIIVTLHYAAVKTIKGFDLLHVVLTSVRGDEVLAPPTEDVYIASPPLNDLWSDEQVAEAAKRVLANVRVRA